MSGVAFAAGVVVGAQHVGSDERVAREFAAAWQRGDAAAMYATLSDDARRRIGPVAFARAYRQAAITATQVSLTVGRTRGAGGHHVAFPVRVATRIFGTVRARVSLPIVQSGGSRRVDWGPYLVFPGLRPGERLTRQTVLPRRASILARDGTPLAQGDQRTSPLGPAASEIVGTLGAPSPDRVDRLRAAGFPPDAEVGVSGLERLFDGRLSGTPGGVLLAGDRPLGRGHSRPDPPLKTSIDAGVQAAATEALAGRYGGVAALRPRTGEILALAGIAFSAPQPPGSTFKIVTAAAALQNGLVTTTTTFPDQTSTRLEGVELQNANGESCGGSFQQAFAQSCNSVFAPLGAKLGARRLVAAARRFGFDGSRPLPGAAASTIPDAESIGDDLAVGSSAIGQGRVQATALEMAVVAATIAGHGRRPSVTLLPRRRAVRTRATSPRVADTLERLMVNTVRFGTGTAAAIPGTEVAGKTGTAELRQTVTTKDQQDAARGTPDATPSKPDPTDTDAWFAGYAPAKNPRLAVCVLLVRSGAGGDTAAPAARTVLQAGL